MQYTKPTQCDQILKILNDQKWHCVTEFLNNYIPRYSARLYELQKRGYRLEKKRVHGKSYETWRLIAQDSLF